MTAATEIKIQIAILWIAIILVVYSIEIKYQVKLNKINDRLATIEKTLDK